MTKKYVLTGSSYSGKTKTLEELGRYGFSTVTEAARMLIDEQLETGGKILPWLNIEAFEEAIWRKQVELEAKIPLETEIAFIDRGISDQLAYIKLRGAEPTPIYKKLFREHRYDGIFLLETIPGYQQDRIRREPLEMVQRLRVLHEETYRELGYDPVVIPVLPVEERAHFILDRV